LIKAVKSNNLEAVKFIFDKKPNIKQYYLADFHIDLQKKCAIHYAVENNNYEMVKLLLKRINTAESPFDKWCYFAYINNKITPHYLAATNKNIKIHKLLMDYYKPIDTRLELQVFNKINGKSMIDLFEELDNKEYSEELKEVARRYSNNFIPITLIYSPELSGFLFGLDTMIHRWENFYWRYWGIYGGYNKFDEINIIPLHTGSTLGYKFNFYKSFHSINIGLGLAFQVNVIKYKGDDVADQFSLLPIELSYRFTYNQNLFIELGIIKFIINFDMVKEKYYHSDIDFNSIKAPDFSKINFFLRFGFL